jgi:hypothetical protein
MELNDIYLDENILYNIIQNLNLNDKMMFCKSNKKIYKIFYKDIKYDIYDSLNDYKLYREFMRRFEYDKYHLEYIGILVLENMETIWINYNEYYDLRYIYECILQNLNINDIKIKNDNMKLLLSVLQNCKRFNRFETQIKVNMEPCLISIHSNLIVI